MKVILNGNISKDALKQILDKQKEKTKVIDEFCKENKISSFYYKDSELEYLCEKPLRQKVEVRKDE